MRRISSLLGAAAIVLFAASLVAQSKVNFTGKWAADAEKNAAAAIYQYAQLTTVGPKPKAAPGK